MSLNKKRSPPEFMTVFLNEVKIWSMSRMMYDIDGTSDYAE